MTSDQPPHGPTTNVPPLPHPIEVQLDDHRARLGLLFGILFLLGGAVVVMAAQRLHDAGGVIGPLIVVFGAGFATIPFLLIVLQRRRWIVRLDSDGVVLRSGRRLPWSALRTVRRRTHRVPTRDVLSHYELAFDGATALVFPARVRNVAEVCKFLDGLVR